MQIQSIFIAIFLNWVAFDQNLFRRREGVFTHGSLALSLSLELEELREQDEIARHRLDVIPFKQRKKQQVVRSKCNHFSGRSKDPRYADQRKIRRRTINL